MSRKILLSILVLGLSLVCGSLLSFDTYAASLNLNNLNGFTTTLTGIGDTQGNIRFQTVYNFSGSGNYLYINSGTFKDYSVNWVYGHKYQIILIVSVDATGADFIIPNAISVSGNNYHTEKDTIESSVSCASSCKYTVIHTIDIIADNTGSELVNISKSNILNLRSSSGLVNGKFNLTTILFDNVDEAMAFRSNLFSKLDAINSDTTDIVSLLESIENSNSSIERNIQSLKDSQDKANDDANDRYQDEKDNIDTNVNGGIGSVDDIDKSINLPSPISFLLGTLSASNCYDISTLAGMVGSSDTQYCSWFNSNVRNIMTPFVDVFVFFIGTMFIWSWVKKGGM